MSSEQDKVSVRVATGVLRAYRLLISPLIGSVCRFEPGCSRYMEQAIHRHGVWKGVGLGLRRLSRCHPFHPGGFDPAP